MNQAPTGLFQVVKTFCQASKTPALEGLQLPTVLIANKRQQAEELAAIVSDRIVLFFIAIVVDTVVEPIFSILFGRKRKALYLK